MDKEILKQKFMSTAYQAGENNSISTWRGHSQGYYYHFVEGAEWAYDQLESENKKLRRIVEIAKKVAYPESNGNRINENFGDLRATIEEYDSKQS